MPQITTIRVVRKRSVQPEQFGSAMAEVELVGNVLEGEDPTAVARQMLVDSRALVYENLGMSLPANAVKAAAEVDTSTETATVETVTGAKPKPKPRGRPPGSGKKKDAPAPAVETPDADIPGDGGIPGEEPNIRSNPENRVDPEDDGIPGDDGVPGEEAPAETEAAPEQDMTAESLFKFINESITSNRLTVMQAKKMQADMKIARVRDLNTPEKVAEAKAMIDGFIAENESD